MLARQIDLDCRRAELRAIHSRDLARAKADASAAEGAAVGAAVGEADAEAKLKIEEAKLEAEEKCIALSESGS